LAARKFECELSAKALGWGHIGRDIFCNEGKGNVSALLVCHFGGPWERTTTKR
jgi:hypothetical protein